MLRNARRAGPRHKKDIQSIQSKIRRFEIKQQKVHRERVSYLMMDVPQGHTDAIMCGGFWLSCINWVCYCIDRQRLEMEEKIGPSNFVPLLL